MRLHKHTRNQPEEPKRRFGALFYFRRVTPGANEEEGNFTMVLFVCIFQFTRVCPPPPSTPFLNLIHTSNNNCGGGGGGAVQCCPPPLN